MDPSWQPDPTGRHHYRWWDGAKWTDVVADDGEESHDPMPPPGPKRIVVSTTPESGQWRAKDPTPMRGVRLGADPEYPDSARVDPTTGLAPRPDPTEPVNRADDSIWVDVTGPTVRTVSAASTGPIDGTAPTEVMPTPRGPSSPGRTVIDTTRNDLVRPDTLGAMPIEELRDARHRYGRWIAAGVVLLAVLGGIIYLVTSRSTNSATTTQNGVTLGKVSGPGDFFQTDVRLERGETVRFRVEGPANRDLITYFLAPKALADTYATDYLAEMGTSTDYSDPSQMIDGFTDARDLFNDQGVRDAVGGYVKLKTVDRCCKGVPDTWSFVATTPGVYRVLVVEADGKDATIRLVIESLGRLLVTSTEVSDAFNNESFFTDSSFFKSTDEFDPNR
jgi:hypothetical protein